MVRVVKILRVVRKVGSVRCAVNKVGVILTNHKPSLTSSSSLPRHCPMSSHEQCY